MSSPIRAQGIFVWAHGLILDNEEQSAAPFWDDPSETTRPTALFSITASRVDGTFVQVLSTPSIDENRKAARFVVCVPLHVCATKYGLPEFHTGRWRDLSRTGILFQSQISCEPGTNLELTVLCAA